MTLAGALPLPGYAAAAVAVAAILAWLLARYECVDLFGVRLRRHQGDERPKRERPRRD